MAKSASKEGNSLSKRKIERNRPETAAGSNEDEEREENSLSEEETALHEEEEEEEDNSDDNEVEEEGEGEDGEDGSDGEGEEGEGEHDEEQSGHDEGGSFNSALDEDEEDDEEEKERLKKDALLYRASLEKRGVIYMSRVPPFMKPNKVRTLLEEYGKITRLFLAEEDAQARSKRKERGGNASKQFREGWIEFADKKIARRVAESLNNTTIGGKKSDYYHDDIWNLKYLKNFKWEYLTEKLAYERRVREMKLKAALAQSKKTNAEMKQLIEQTKVQEIINQRKRNRSQQEGAEEPRHGVDSNRMKRRFKQHKVLGVDYDEKDNKVDKSLLNSIFTTK